MDFTTQTTGERFLADGAQFQRRTDAEVDRKAVLLVDTNDLPLFLLVHDLNQKKQVTHTWRKMKFAEPPHLALSML